MILVTGATGNVGAELVRALVQAGAEVRGVSRGSRGTTPAPGAEAVIHQVTRPGYASCCNSRPCAEFGPRGLPFAGTCRFGATWTVETSAGSQSLTQAWSYEVLACPMCR